MKIFSWVKSKLHGKDNTIKPEPELVSYHMMQQSRKEDFSGCSSTLLAIGTFGNDLKDSDTSNIEETTEDNLENAATQESEEADDIFLDSEFLGESENHNLSIQKCWDNLPEDEEITHEFTNNASESRSAILQRTTSVHRKKGMYKKSFSFLLKKAFLCGGGFVPRPILKDPFPDLKLDNSTMDKILKAMVREKKYRQTQKYLDMVKTDNEEQGEGSNASNWDKTESE